MTTPPAFAAMRREVATVVEAAQKAERESNRPEARPAFPRDEALATMQREVGQMFDPELFPKFLGLVIRTGVSAPQMMRV